MAHLPAQLRWPAEWERHAATWLTWPHNRDTWPHLLDRVEAAFVEMVRALLPHEEVRINVIDEAMEDDVRRRLAGDADGPRFFHIPSDDAWARDHGPVFVLREDAPRLLVMDFDFDAWGGKYPPWDCDAAVAGRCAEAIGAARYQPGFVLEGGSIDGDGMGTILTTEACLLNGNRCRHGDQPRTRALMESRLVETLGARQVIWLADGIVGDDTDGHIDDFARFVAPGRVVCAVEDEPADPNHAPLGDALLRLRDARDATGRALDVVPLPMPPPVLSEGERCPASYANFYLANGVALVPTFGAPTDERALGILAECLEGREIVAIDARDLVVGLGAVHCLTQQVPEP
jgi:agmatine deiminase